MKREKQEEKLEVYAGGKKTRGRRKNERNCRKF
jgi:hypothetical protein